MDGAKMLSVLVLLVATMSVCQGEKDLGNLLAEVSTSSIRATGWLAKYISRADFDFDLGEVAHIGAFYQLLSGKGAEDNIGPAIKQKICGSHTLCFKNATTRDLLWYTLGCKALQFCPKKNCSEDLAVSLLGKLRYFPEKGFNHPVGLSLALITISLYDIETPWSHVRTLISRSRLRNSMHAADTRAYALLALSAVYGQKFTSIKKKEVYQELTTGLKEVNYALTQNKGNAVTTALLLQAKNAVEKVLRLKSQQLHEDSIRKLMLYQQNDGSFGSSMATTESLMALSGHTFLDLYNITVGKETPEVQSIVACISVHFQDDPSRDPPTQFIRVYSNSTAFDVLQKAAQKHPCYKFTHKRYSWGVYLTHVCGVEQNHAEKKYWMLYVGEKPAQHGISSLKVQEGQCTRLVYKKVKF